MTFWEDKKGFGNWRCRIPRLVRSTETEREMSE